MPLDIVNQSQGGGLVQADLAYLYDVPLKTNTIPYPI